MNESEQQKFETSDIGNEKIPQASFDNTLKLLDEMDWNQKEINDSWYEQEMAALDDRRKNEIDSVLTSTRDSENILNWEIIKDNFA